MNAEPALATLPKLRTRRPGKGRLPSVHFDIVDSCQLRCVGCPNSGLIRKPQFMAPELFRRSLRNLDVRRVDVFRLFNYGEPLLHPELETLGLILRDERPFEIGALELSTNAQTSATAKLEALAAQGLLSRLVISCDGDGTPESYEALRPPGRWDRLLEFLSFARDLARRHPRLQLMSRTIIWDEEHAKRWRAVLEPFGVKPQFRGWQHLPDSKENHTGRAFQMGRGVCFYAGGRVGLYVNHRAEIVPCCVHPGAAVLGNLADAPYSQSFGGAQHLAFLDELAERRAQMPVCGRCEVGALDAYAPGPAE